MRNYIQPGEVIDYVNTTGALIASGDPIVIESCVAVASCDIAAGEEGSAAVEGVFRLPKVAAGAIAQGAAVYLTSGGNVTATATGNTAAGYAWFAAADGDSTIAVKLNG